MEEERQHLHKLEKRNIIPGKMYRLYSKDLIENGEVLSDSYAELFQDFIFSDEDDANNHVDVVFANVNQNEFYVYHLNGDMSLSKTQPNFEIDTLLTLYNYYVDDVLQYEVTVYFQYLTMLEKYPLLKSVYVPLTKTLIDNHSEHFQNLFCGWSFPYISKIFSTKKYRSEDDTSFMFEQSLQSYENYQLTNEGDIEYTFRNRGSRRQQTGNLILDHNHFFIRNDFNRLVWTERNYIFVMNPEQPLWFIELWSTNEEFRKDILHVENIDFVFSLFKYYKYINYFDNRALHECDENCEMIQTIASYIILYIFANNRFEKNKHFTWVDDFLKIFCEAIDIIAVPFPSFGNEEKIPFQEQVELKKSLLQSYFDIHFDVLPEYTQIPFLDCIMKLNDDDEDKILLHQYVKLQRNGKLYLNEFYRPFFEKMQIVLDTTPFLTIQEQIALIKQVVLMNYGENEYQKYENIISDCLKKSPIIPFSNADELKLLHSFDCHRKLLLELQADDVEAIMLTPVKDIDPEQTVLTTDLHIYDLQFLKAAFRTQKNFLTPLSQKVSLNQMIYLKKPFEVPKYKIEKEHVIHNHKYTIVLTLDPGNENNKDDHIVHEATALTIYDGEKKVFDHVPLPPGINVFDEFVFKTGDDQYILFLNHYSGKHLLKIEQKVIDFESNPDNPIINAFTHNYFYMVFLKNGKMLRKLNQYHGQKEKEIIQKLERIFAQSGQDENVFTDKLVTDLPRDFFYDENEYYIPKKLMSGEYELDLKKFFTVHDSNYIDGWLEKFLPMLPLNDSKYISQDENYVKMKVKITPQYANYYLKQLQIWNIEEIVVHVKKGVIQVKKMLYWNDDEKKPEVYDHSIAEFNMGLFYEYIENELAGLPDGKYNFKIIHF